MIVNCMTPASPPPVQYREYTNMVEVEQNINLQFFTHRAIPINQTNKKLQPNKSFISYIIEKCRCACGETNGCLRSSSVQVPRTLKFQLAKICLAILQINSCIKNFSAS